MSYAGLSPTEAKRLARIIDRANANNPVPFQFAVRTRAKSQAPFGVWVRVADSVTSSRKDAERIAAAIADEYTDTSIISWSTDGY